MEAGGIVASPTFMYPVSSVTLSKHFFYLMLICPTSATTSVMRYEVFRNKNSTDEEVKAEVDFFKQVENEDKWLGNNAQRGLNSDTYVAGPLHPYMERAVEYFESVHRPMLKKHVEEERALGRQIWPARRSMKNDSLEKDEEFCRSICESSGKVNKVLAW